MARRRLSSTINIVPLRGFISFFLSRKEFGVLGQKAHQHKRRQITAIHLSPNFFLNQENTAAQISWTAILKSGRNGRNKYKVSREVLTSELDSGRER
jgi:hypothetical protein